MALAAEDNWDQRPEQANQTPDESFSMIVGSIYVVGLQSWRTHGRVRTGVDWVSLVSSWSGVPITV
jgi:hypothetical protein